MVKMSKTTPATTKENRTANRLVCVNQKGGTGKTTTALNVSAALSEAGDDVLVVDLDPQGYLTDGLGYEDLYQSEDLNLADLLLNVEERDRVTDLIVSHPEVDLIPSNIDMFRLENELVNARRREERLSMLLDEVDARTEYDWIVIDSPPTLGPLTDNALLAAGRVLVPAQSRTSSIRAIEILMDQIDSLEDMFDATIEIEGVVVNEITQDNESREMVAWFEDVFGADSVWEIRKRVAIQRAYNNGVSILRHDEDCDMEAVYREIAGDLRGGEDGE